MVSTLTWQLSLYHGNMYETRLTRKSENLLVLLIIISELDK